MEAPREDYTRNLIEAGPKPIEAIGAEEADVAEVVRRAG